MPRSIRKTALLVVVAALYAAMVVYGAIGSLGHDKTVGATLVGGLGGGFVRAMIGHHHGTALDRADIQVWPAYEPVPGMDI